MHLTNIVELWCWNKECTDYGKINGGNVVFKETYGNNQNRLFKCTTCGHCFSETHGTPFLSLKQPGKKFCGRWRYSQKKEAFAALPEHQVMVKIQYRDG